MGYYNGIRKKRSLNVSTTNQIRVCRWCEQDIPQKETSIVMEQIHVSPKRVDLHFHPQCIIEMQDLILDILEELYKPDSEA